MLVWVIWSCLRTIGGHSLSQVFVWTVCRSSSNHCSSCRRRFPLTSSGAPRLRRLVSSAARVSDHKHGALLPLQEKTRSVCLVLIHIQLIIDVYAQINESIHFIRVHSVFNPAGMQNQTGSLRPSAQVRGGCQSRQGHEQPSAGRWSVALEAIRNEWRNENDEWYNL